jgi:hypothetical protein
VAGVGDRGGVVVGCAGVAGIGGLGDVAVGVVELVELGLDARAGVAFAAAMDRRAELGEDGGQGLSEGGGRGEGLLGSDVAEDVAVLGGGEGARRAGVEPFPERFGR